MLGESTASLETHTHTHIHRGPWVAHSVERPTPDFGSGHDLTVHEFESCIRLCVHSVEPAWDSPSLCLSLSHKINK